MLTIHHLASSRSLRIIWLCEELGLSYQIKHYEKPMDGEENPLLSIHPLASSPTIEDEKNILVESGAIVEYLLDHYDRMGLRPPIASEDYQLFRQWLHFSEGTLMPTILQHQSLIKMGSARVPFFARSILKKLVLNTIDQKIAPKLERQLQFINESLEQHSWLCGNNFSAADIMIAFPLMLAETSGLIPTHLTNIHTFLNACRNREGFESAQSKATAILSLENHTQQPCINQTSSLPDNAELASSSIEISDKNE